MDAEKAEFKRLIELMGWSQTEAARRLHKTPSAINHLINPEHSNKPTQTTMQLLKLIIASERPYLINTQTFELKEGPMAAREEAGLTPRERDMFLKLKQLPESEQERVYTVILALLGTTEKQGGKTKN